MKVKLFHVQNYPLLACLLVLLSCGREEKASLVQETIRLSTQASQAGDYVEYRRLIEELVRIEPENYRYRYYLARAHALNGDPVNAAKELNFLMDQEYELALMANQDAFFRSVIESPEFRQTLDRIREKARPLDKSTVAFTIPEKDLIPEGIAYDPVDETFYLGSLQKCKIIRINQNGQITDFTQSGQDGLLPVLGMRVDAERRVLWAVSSYGFYQEGLSRDLLGNSGIFKYDLKSGNLIKKYMLPQEEKHYLNDLTIAPNGDIYATDWLVFGIYKISAADDTLKKILDMNRAPNGIDISGDGKRLFIAGSGIGVLELSSGTYKELKQEPHFFLAGDGLYYYQKSLIGIANDKVNRYYLNRREDRVIRVEPLEAFHPLFDIPTTGAIGKDGFYFIANSQLQYYDDQGRLFPIDMLKEVKILKVELR